MHPVWCAYSDRWPLCVHAWTTLTQNIPRTEEATTTTILTGCEPYAYAYPCAVDMSLEADRSVDESSRDKGHTYVGRGMECSSERWPLQESRSPTFASACMCAHTRGPGAAQEACARHLDSRHASMPAASC